MLQSLAAGQTITQIYTVTIVDNNGAAISQDVAVVITGTNDKPTITSEDLIGAVTESQGEDVTLTNSGIICFDDVDLIDAHIVLGNWRAHWQHARQPYCCCE